MRAFISLLKTEFAELWASVYRPSCFDDLDHATSVMTELTGYDWRHNWTMGDLVHCTKPSAVWPRYSARAKGIGRRTLTNQPSGLPGLPGSKERIAYYASIVAIGNNEFDDSSLQAIPRKDLKYVPQSI